jgi:RHS repeat-associated protein
MRTIVGGASGGSVSSPFVRSIQLLVALGCSVAVSLVVGIAPASAVKVSEAERREAEAHEEHFEYHPYPIEEKTEVCSRNACHEGPRSVVPPGEYLESRIAGFDAIRVHEFGEDDCHNIEREEGCTAYNTERPEASYDYLAPKYRELSQTIFSGNLSEDGDPSINLVFIYAWRPTKRRHRVRRRERFGLANKALKNVSDPCRGDPVDCATGDEVDAQTDLSVPALGVPFALERTYNSQAAARAASAGLFGYGWSSSFSDHLEFDSETNSITVVQENGSTVVFFGQAGSVGELSGPPWSQAKLVYTNEGVYKYTLPDQETLTFNSAGRLLNESERNGNVTTVSYTENESCEGGCHKTLESIQISDPASRKITLTVDAAGQVETATDPMGHTVKYAYEGGNLASVTLPGESSPRWRYKYNSEHEMTEMINGLGGKTTTEYNAADQVSAQTSPLGDTQHFEYEEISSGSAGYAATTIDEEGEEEEASEVIEPWEAEGEWYQPPPESLTTITDSATGAVEKEHFNDENELTSVTRGSGSALATTEEFAYNASDEMTSRKDGNGHKTEYRYDEAGDRTSEKDPDGDTTEWEYDSEHDVTGIKTPDGETTTIERDSHGNAIKVSSPAPGETTQATKYKYASDGELESMTNPLGKEWKYEYDSYGDRKSETDPEANKRTWEYNEDSQDVAEVSPRGNASGAKASEFTTKVERSAQGRPLKITDPLGHTTKYTYDADGNIETMTDGDSNKTTYSYNADNELTKAEEPNKTVTETGYDALGEITSQTDGNKHATKYVRNVLEQVEEVVNPLGKKTLKEYDAAGNLIKLTDPATRTTTYTYDPANRLTEVSYSSGKPATVKYEYSKDGYRTKMTDATGTTTYTYDQLDRLTESESGHKEVIKYEYNLGDEQTKLTYPNKKAVERAYDKDGRLEKVTDWSGDITKFSYNPDSELATTTFPSATKEADTYAYNDADQMTEVKMDKSTEVLASLVYTRDNDGQVKKTTAKKLPGAEVTEATYDVNSRLMKYGGTEYKYDGANNPTTEGSITNSYNEGDELEKGTGVRYTYDELGDRTKATPEKGPATTYGYDQAGNLTSVERPKEGETSEIKDTYAYNGEDLRTSQTISGATSYLAWDTTEELPLILSDSTSSYIYGPGDMPLEQINNTTGTVTYLHHDQAGSTRLLTGSTGKTEGSYSYSPYGTPEHTGTATTPLGYDGEYTSSDTGLIYLRAREYDPATGQFLTRDPLAAISGAPYSYAGDNPLNRSDPTGLLPFGIKLPSWEEAGEAVAGWGDTITFGLTKKIREGIGDENVDTCSGAYQSGGVAGLVTGALIPGEDDAEAGELGVEGVDEGADVGSTPEGRPFTQHYGLETGPERNIPGSVVDQTINENPGVPGRNGTTVYYDPNNDVTVVTGRNGSIVSARRGEP